MYALEAQQLTKIYPDGTEALRNVEMRILKGTICAILGENGAGKTTLVNIACTLLNPTSGTMSVLGNDVVAQSEKVRSKIALVPQDASTIGFMTAHEFVKFYLVSRGVSLREACSLSKRALEELGISEVSNKITDVLSGGLRRRVQLAAVLATDAELIFLDEPTRGLDPIARRSFWSKLLVRKKTGKTMVVTTHSATEAETIADYIIILNKGSLIFQGAPDMARKEMRYSHKIVIERSEDIHSSKDLIALLDLPSDASLLSDEVFFSILTYPKNIDDLVLKALRRDLTVKVMPTTLEDFFIKRVKEA